MNWDSETGFQTGGFVYQCDRVPSLVHFFISTSDVLLTSGVVFLLSLCKSTFACDFIFYFLSLAHAVFIANFLSFYILHSWPEILLTILSYVNIYFNLPPQKFTL